MISCEKDWPYIGFSHCPVCSAKYATEMGQAIRKLETALAAMTAERDELRKACQAALDTFMGIRVGGVIATEIVLRSALARAAVEGER